MTSRISLAGSTQWLVGDWRTVVEMTTPAGGTANGRLKWSSGKTATTRNARLVLDDVVIDSEGHLPTSGAQLLGGAVTVPAGSRLQLQVAASGSQQAACMIQPPKSGMFGIGADAGTYVEVV